MILKSFTIPKKSREIFIDPVYEDIPGLIETNKERFLSCDFDVNGIPFRKLREQARSDTLKIAGEYTEKIELLCSNLNIETTKHLYRLHDAHTQNKSIILTGHAPTLAHPGIMIKHSLVNRISKKAGGIGINMVVDNDASHDNCLNIPDINGLASTIEKIALLSNLHNYAFEEIRYTDAAQLIAFREEVLTLLHNPDMKKIFDDFMEIVIKLSKETLEFSNLFTYARHVFLSRYEINNLEVPVSHISETDSFLHFFLHITAHTKSFVDIYNAKLREYRRLKKISSKANPLPDLMEKGYVVEMPFWIWKEGEPRQSLYASVANERRISIICNNSILTSFDFNEQDRISDNTENLERLKGVTNTGLKIRPKAIINTMYARMFFSDLFIHGIGGAKYDLVTDEIIRDFFGVEPPSYAVISATLHLPYKPFDVSEEYSMELRHIIKDMDYNPDRYASEEIMENAEMKSMATEKKDLITKETNDRKEKHQIFERVRLLNSLMKEKIRPLIEEKKKDLEDLEKKLRYNSIVTNREYPFCIYPEAMLRSLFKQFC